MTGRSDTHPAEGLVVDINSSAAGWCTVSAPPPSTSVRDMNLPCPAFITFFLSVPGVYNVIFAGFEEDGRPLPAGPEGALLAPEQDRQDRGSGRVSA